MPRFALDIESVPRPVRAQELLDAVNHRVVIADGAMGTMLQGRELSLEDDFLGLEGCNEILNATRPDVLADIHDAYFATGIDAVETNTFGANWSNLSDYGIDDRIEELARKGAEIARERAEAAEKTDGRMRWVLGSMGPGTKLPSLGHTTYDYLKQTFALQAEGLIDGGADAFLIETSQDLLQTKAAVNGCKQAIVTRGIRLPIFVEVTVETTGTMLMGSEIGAALTALEPLGVDAIGLNCATGPDEMSEHLRHLVQAVLRGHRLHAQRRPARPWPQRRALPALTHRTRHRARAVRARIRPGPRGRLLRYDAGAHGRRRRAPCALPHQRRRHQRRAGAPTAAAFPPSVKPASLPSTIT